MTLNIKDENFVMVIYSHHTQMFLNLKMKLFISRMD